MIELELKEIEKSFGSSKIFSNVTFEVQSLERVGLIGRNGTGKTTVFKIIAGIEKQDNGSIFIKKNSTLGYLDQIPTYSKEFKVIDVLNIAFESQHEISKQLKKLELQMTGLEGKKLEKCIKKVW